MILRIELENYLAEVQKEGEDCEVSWRVREILEAPRDAPQDAPVDQHLDRGPQIWTRWPTGGTLQGTFPPLFGGWTPTYGGDLCKGGHPPSTGYKDDQGRDRCNRCGRFLDLRRCHCGQQSHSGALGGVARSFCDVRSRLDRADVGDHPELFPDPGVLQSEQT